MIPRQAHGQLGNHGRTRAAAAKTGSVRQDHPAHWHRALTNTEGRSCTLCRKRKIRCNRQLPCDNCAKSRTGHCDYDGVSVSRGASDVLSTRRLGAGPAASTVTTSLGHSPLQSAPASTGVSTPASQSSSTREVESLRTRVRELEDLLRKTSPADDLVGGPSNDFKVAPRAGGVGPISRAFHINQEHPPWSGGEPISRSVIHKGRLFGQSHWVNGVAPVCLAPPVYPCIMTKTY